MKIYCDEKEIKPTVIMTFEKMDRLYREKEGKLLYIQGSLTFDTLRYGKNDSKLPFEFTFTDRFNHKWKVVINMQDDAVNMFIPCGTQMLWYGADESPTRTGSDAQTNWAQVEFSWQDKTYRPPYHAGVRIVFTAYKDDRNGEWNVDTQRWNNILDLTKRGTEVTGAIIDQVGKVKGMP